ncbi:GNAT family N-acetyltransferase [Alteromonas halophila]|uniref:N-acetyltransferase domain-containing protein n=1 Tax=Alteromonas halophila TaxID=516698 RepID=A0A918JDZ9_9ALTE|nr:GNAT family N-acetyltransferase [Alteromonas halophila]GGW74775.1 hypothetical protein GCM10007391_03540 [Alteromonas halophila]
MRFHIEAHYCQLLRSEHKDTYCQLYMSPKVMRKIAQPLTLSQAETAFTNALRQNEQTPWRKRVWVISNDTGNDAGIQMLIRHSNAPTVAEIGIMLYPFANGRRIAGKALGGLVDYGFTHLGLERINALFDCTHLATQRLVEGIGFTVFPAHKDHAGRHCLEATITQSEHLAIRQQARS